MLSPRCSNQLQINIVTFKPALFFGESPINKGRLVDIDLRAPANTFPMATSCVAGNRTVCIPHLHLLPLPLDSVQYRGGRRGNLFELCHLYYFQIVSGSCWNWSTGRNKYPDRGGQADLRTSTHAGAIFNQI